MTLFHKRLVIVIMAVFALAVLSVGLLYDFWPRPYFLNELTMQGTDDSGKVIWINFQAIRSQTIINYDHYYTATVKYDGQIFRQMTQFSKFSDSIVPQGLLKSFNNYKNTEQAEEEYNLAFTIDGHELSIEIPTIQADFLAKSNYRYVRYIGVGSFKGTIDQKSIRGNVKADVIMSSDGKQATISRGVKYSGQSISLWDEMNNYYQIDVSEVAPNNTGYSSHQWALYKSAASGEMRKLRQMNIARTTSSLIITLPELNDTKISLTQFSALPADTNNQSGLATGVITDTTDQRNIAGEYQFYNN
ncbi:MAG: hypothetical protein WCK11_05335 [Candidatus Falkowbacteria bacterium]